MGLFGGARQLSMKMFSRKKSQNAIVLELRGVVVASAIEDCYIKRKRLGEGQTAMVYEGLRHVDGKAYALKEFKIAGDEKTAGESLRDEVQCLRALPDHPNICIMIECISTPGCVHLALEMVAGGDLLSPIEEKGAYSENTARSLFAQIVDAVDCMHQAGIVQAACHHRGPGSVHTGDGDGGRRQTGLRRGGRRSLHSGPKLEFGRCKARHTI